MNKNLLVIVFNFVLLFFISGSSSLAQSFNVLKCDSTEVEKKDLVDVLQNLRADSTVQSENGPYFSILPVVGYSMESGVTYALVSNTSFYTDKNKTRFSNILANAYYSQYHQYWATITSNIFFEKSGLHLIGDTRYFKFPTQTYGIGSETLLSDILHIEYSYLRFYQSVFREFRFGQIEVSQHAKMRIEIGCGNTLRLG